MAPSAEAEGSGSGNGSGSGSGSGESGKRELGRWWLFKWKVRVKEVVGERVVDDNPHG